MQDPVDMAPQTILLATDLSCRSDRALDRATILATEWGARLVVVHALQEPSGREDLPSWRRRADPRQLAWQRVQQDLRDADKLDVQIVVEREEPAALVLATAERFGCELLVTGAAREETLGRILLGTTVEQLLNKSAAPVLVVKRRPRGPYRDVVVATDFSEGSRRALEVALELLPAAQISLFHAFDVPLRGLMNDPAAASEAWSNEAATASQAFLAATPKVAASRRFIATQCESGPVTSLLAELLETRDIDLVAMGTEGRGYLAGRLLGSVALTLLNTLPVDMLVARRPRA
ncbi:universal stress protein [Nannocystis pusilla]|uniref:universal stress protein n=1 Tax=Nannocystis pusilla TaxID=889268 RepID=UPI001CCD85F5